MNEDPRSALCRYRAAGGDESKVRAHDIDELLAHCGAWMRQRARAAALRSGVDADDLFQTALERLLRSATTFDTSAPGLRTYLARIIDWVAVDLARASHSRSATVRERGSVAFVPEVPDRETSTDDFTALESTVDQELLRRAGLNHQQVQILLNECRGPDLKLREFAELTGRSYATVRKDKARALRRIEEWIDLTDEERRAFVARRTFGSTSEAARRLGISVENLKKLVETADEKIRRAFS